MTKRASFIAIGLMIAGCGESASPPDGASIDAVEVEPNPSPTNSPAGQTTQPKPSASSPTNPVTPPVTPPVNPTDPPDNPSPVDDPEPEPSTTPNPEPSTEPGSPSAGGLEAELAEGGLPCEVRDIIANHCADCHQGTTQFGAPMALTSAADFRAAAPAPYSGQSIGERAIARATAEQLPMPPAPYETLSAEQIAVLTDWIDAGAPDSTCDEEPVYDVEPQQPPSPTEADLPPDVTCYDITARASAQGGKYQVPESPDLYQCFDYTPPWGDKDVQVVAGYPIIDNSRVLHHWILYNRSVDVVDGSNATCIGAHPDASFIHGWAPGGDPIKLPEDVGLRTEAGGFSLEMHYNNTAGPDEMDASGVRLCVTEKKRPNEAAVHWLGSQALNTTVATGTCIPFQTEPVTIISSSPHMHLQGRHMKTVINRVDGSTEVLHDKPFDFNTQITYLTPATVYPGDTLTTTCTFAQPTPFGQGTNEEMCYNFVVAYPAGQLAQLIQGLRKYDCVGLF